MKYKRIENQDGTYSYIPTFQFDDGGRSNAGFKGFTGDCAVRALSIATELPYKYVYDKINELAKNEKASKRRRGISNARTGVHTITFKKFIEEELGWKWVPTMGFGTGCKVHLRYDELPEGRIIVNLSRHFAAVIDGIVHDTYDPSRGGSRCVYGYWIKD